MQSDSAASHPQWTEKEVRKLLKLLKRPHLLAEFPLARALAQALGKSSAMDAVTTAIEQTFIDRGVVGERLRDLLWRCDIASATQAAAAADMNLSPRQFFRYRSEAVAALVAYINRLLVEPTADHVDPIDALARLLEDVDPETTVRLHSLGKATSPESAAHVGARVKAGEAFRDFNPIEGDNPPELLAAAKAALARQIHGDGQGAREITKLVRERVLYRASPLRGEIEFEASVVDFVAARQSGVAAEMSAAAKHLRELGLADAGLGVRAMLFEAEANIVAGQLEAAESALSLVESLAWDLRSIRDLGIATLRRAQVAFARGHASHAFELATAAQLVLRRVPYSDFQCRLLLARISLLLGAPFRLEETPYGPPSWNYAYATALRARSLVSAGSFADAAAAAENAARYTDQYHAVRAFNEATLAGIAFGAGDEAAAQAHLIAAWSTAVKTQNHLLARDLFENAGLRNRDLGPIAYDDAFCGAVMSMLKELFPHIPQFADTASAARFGVELRRVVLASVTGSAGAPSFGSSNEERPHGRNIEALSRTLAFAFAMPLKFEMRELFTDALAKNAALLLSQL